MFYCRHLMQTTITVMGMINIWITTIIWDVLIQVAILQHIHNHPFNFQDKAILLVILLLFIIWLINNPNHKLPLDNRNISHNNNRFSNNNSCNSSNNSSNNSRTAWMHLIILPITQWVLWIIRKRMKLNLVWINSNNNNNNNNLSTLT